MSATNRLEEGLNTWPIPIKDALKVQTFPLMENLTSRSLSILFLLDCRL